MIAEYSRNGDIQINSEVTRLIEENGFSINHGKTGIFNNGVRQVVTGVVVNKKCNFRRGDYRYLRSLFHYWKKVKREDAERAEDARRILCWQTKPEENMNAGSLTQMGSFLKEVYAITYRDCLPTI